MDMYFYCEILHKFLLLMQQVVDLQHLDVLEDIVVVLPLLYPPTHPDVAGLLPAASAIKICEESRNKNTYPLYALFDIYVLHCTKILLLVELGVIFTENPVISTGVILCVLNVSVFIVCIACNTDPAGNK